MKASVEDQTGADARTDRHVGQAARAIRGHVVEQAGSSEPDVVLDRARRAELLGQVSAERDVEPVEVRGMPNDAGPDVNPAGDANADRRGRARPHPGRLEGCPDRVNDGFDGGGSAGHGAYRPAERLAVGVRDDRGHLRPANVNADQRLTPRNERQAGSGEGSGARHRVGMSPSSRVRSTADAPSTTALSGSTRPISMTEPRVCSDSAPRSASERTRSSQRSPSAVAAPRPRLSCK